MQSGEYSGPYFLLIGFRFFLFSADAFSVGAFVSDGDVDAGDSDSLSAFVKFVRATGMAGLAGHVSTGEGGPLGRLMNRTRRAQAVKGVGSERLKWGQVRVQGWSKHTNL